MKRVLLSWSSGKDSAWTLHVLRQQPDIELVGLVTTLNTEFQRVAMRHAPLNHRSPGHGRRATVMDRPAALALFQRSL